MHPNLVVYVLIKLLLESDYQSQLLVSTHYNPILKAIDDIFGKDSVWFTEKGKDGNTSLYSISDFNGLNKLSSIPRLYEQSVRSASKCIVNMARQRKVRELKYEKIRQPVNDMVTELRMASI